MIGYSDGAEPGIQCQCPVKRTLFNLLWNCVSTTIICTWVSVHPNVPPSGQWKGLWRRLEMMFWTIVAPELILAWAVRQWYAAWEIKDAVNGVEEGLFVGLKRIIKGWTRRREEAPSELAQSSRWTMEHGHLLAMGGINTVDPSFENMVERDPRGHVLTIERYKELITTDKGAMLNLKLGKITEADVKDRSKGDFLSKLIAILQTTWFILQCIARGAQGLALTELELVTLALASLNAVTYAFWWHKPLGVQEPIRIYIATNSDACNKIEHDEEVSEAQMAISDLMNKFGRMVKRMATGILKFVLDPCQEGLCKAIITLLVIIPIALLVSVVHFMFLPSSLGVLLLLKILKTRPVTEEPSHTRGLIVFRVVISLHNLRYRVTSYVSRVSEAWLKEFLDEESASGLFIGWIFILPSLFLFLLAITILLLPFFALLFLISIIFTAVFGIITSNTVASGAAHVPPFYSPKTESDKHSRMVVFALFGVIFGGLHCIGWNFSYATTFEQHLWRASSLAITVIPFIVAPIDFVLENFDLDKGFLKGIHLTLDLVMTIFLFVYVLARLSLIGQALALLRNQPQTAFLAIDWTQYIPHIF